MLTRTFSTICQLTTSPENYYSTTVDRCTASRRWPKYSHSKSCLTTIALTRHSMTPVVTSSNPAGGIVSATRSLFPCPDSGAMARSGQNRHRPQFLRKWTPSSLTSLLRTLMKWALCGLRRLILSTCWESNNTPAPKSIWKHFRRNAARLSVTIWKMSTEK